MLNDICGHSCNVGPPICGEHQVVIWNFLGVQIRRRILRQAEHGDTFGQRFRIRFVRTRQLRSGADVHVYCSSQTYWGFDVQKLALSFLNSVDAAPMRCNRI